MYFTGVPDCKFRTTFLSGHVSSRDSQSKQVQQHDPNEAEAEKQQQQGHETPFIICQFQNVRTGFN